VVSRVQIYNVFELRISLHVVQFSPTDTSSFLSPWHPVLRHPQSVFLPLDERPSFTTLRKLSIYLISCMEQSLSEGKSHSSG
jgi:hypothetical protein